MQNDTCIHYTNVQWERSGFLTPRVGAIVLLLRPGNLRAYCQLSLDKDRLGYLNSRETCLALVQRVSAQEGRHVTQP